MSRKIKKGLLFGFFSLFLACLLFPVDIFLYALKWQTEHALQKALNARVYFEKVALQKGEIHFFKGHVAKSKELLATFSAVLNPHFSLKKREIGGELRIENLKIIRRKFKKESLPFFKSDDHFFSLNLHTSINEAELYLYDYSGTSSFFQRYYFDLTHRIAAKEGEGQIVFYQDPLCQRLSSFCFKTQKNHLILSGEFSSESFPRMYALSAYFFNTTLEGWDFVSGRIDGKMELWLDGKSPASLKADVIFSDVQGENSQLEILAQIEKVSASVDTDFSQRTGLNGDFLVQGGKLALQDKPKVYVGFWDVKDLHSRVSIKKSKLESSTLQANFLGLQGEVVIDGDSDDLIRMAFRGSSEEMYSFFPGGFQKGFQKAFPNDFIDLVAQVKKGKSGLELEGVLKTKEEGKKENLIEFGCHLGQVEKKEIALNPLTPSLSSSMEHFLEHVKEQFCLTSKRLGWFRAKELPLDKFLSPFLFKDINMQLFATVDIEATFDERYLVLFYEGEDFHLKSPHFELKARSPKKTSSLNDCEENGWAVHCIDLENFTHVGFLPLKSATYFQKNYQLVIENATALMQFEDNIIRLKQIQTGWEDLAFQGNIEIQIKSLEDIDVEIVSNSFSGSTKSAFTFVSHFVPLKVWQLPVEKGDVEGFFSFKYHFSPKAELREGFIRGKMKECKLCQKHYQIDKIGCDFEYDFSKNSLLFNDSTAKLYLPFNNKEYALSAPRWLLRDFPFFQTDFSLELKEAGKEPWLIEGITYEKESGREICINGNLCKIHAIQLSNSFNLLDFSYENLKGEGCLKIYPKALEIERLSCSNDVAKEIVFSGILDIEEMRLSGTLEKIELDLQQTLKKYPSFKPKGHLIAKGAVDWQFDKNLEITTTVSYKDLELGNISFGSGGNLKCGYSTETGLEVEGLELELAMKGEFHKCNLGKIIYNLEEKKLELVGFDFSFSKEKFDAISKTLEKICPGKFPPLLLDILKNAKKGNPLEGKVSIEIFPENIWVSLYLKDGVYHLAGRQIELKDFSLIYDPKEINIWTQCQYENAHCWLHFLADSLSMSKGRLAISDQKQPHEIEDSKEKSILVDWAREKGEGFKIRTLEGCFSGVELALQRSEKQDDLDWILLKGKVGVDLQRITPHLWGVVQRFVTSYSLAGAYQIEGAFGFHKKNKQASVSGLILGKEISISGIQMSDFSSTVTYQNDALLLKNFSLRDLAGRMSIDKVNIHHQGDDWQISVQDAHLNDLRFSKLRCNWLKMDQRKRPLLRFLTIPSLSLDHFSGVLGKAESMKGAGELEFTNLPKKNFFSSLLFIPTEITARIGLDLSTLVPVRGKIVYEIKDSKVNLLELKEMFSDGKHSRFYLADQSSAYVDFKGNLNVRIKMKQYNLLMKLAEFFTISVRGTVFRPTYTFSNHIDDGESV